MWCFFCWEWSTIWTAVAAIATIALAYIAKVQLEKAADISDAQFIANYNKDFFNPFTTELLTLFEFGFMEYHSTNKGVIKELPEDFSYFKVTMKDYKRNSANIPAYLNGHSNIYACYEIDNNLLNCFEDMAMLENRNSLSIDIIDDSFGFYIKLISKNPQIIEYIKNIREEYEDNTIFEKFEKLAVKIKALEKTNG